MSIAPYYDNPVVLDKMAELDQFSWNDQYSEELVKKSNLMVEPREEFIFDNKIKYIGEWFGNKRHGKGV